MANTSDHRWLTTDDLRARFRISRTTLWDWVKRGLLPKPHHLGVRAVWRPAEIDAAERKLVQPPTPEAA